MELIGLVGSIVSMMADLFGILDSTSSTDSITSTTSIDSTDSIASTTSITSTMSSLSATSVFHGGGAGAGAHGGVGAGTHGGVGDEIPGENIIRAKCKTRACVWRRKLSGVSAA